MQIDSIQIGDYSFEIHNDIELTFQRNRDNMFLSKNGYSVIVPMASADYPGIISRQNKEFLDDIMNYGVLTDKDDGIQIYYNPDYAALYMPYTKYKYQGGDMWIVANYLKRISINQATGTTAGLITAKHNSFIYSFINKNIVVCDKDKSPVMVSNGNSSYIKLYHIKHGDGMSKITQIQLHTATPTSAGLISLEDKTKLDSLSSNIPTVLSNELLTYGDENGDGLSFRNDSDGNTYLYIPTTKLEEDGTVATKNRSTEVPVVNNSSNGLMSKEDKIKLDNITNNSLLNEKESKFINFLTEGKDLGPNILNRGVINFRQVDSNLNGSTGGFMFKHTDRGTTVLEYAYTLIKENGDIIHDKDSTILPNVNDVSPGLMTPAQKAKLDSLGTIPVYNSIEEVPSDITSKCIVTVDGTPYMMEKCSMITNKDTAPVSTYKLWTTLYTDEEEQGTGAITYISYMRYIDGQWTNVYDDFAYDYFTNLRLTADTAAGVVRDSFRGKPDGIASLDSNGIIPSSQLPSYVDDVIEVYATYNKDNAGNLSNIQIYTDAAHTNSITGESGKIYVNIAENEPNYQLRWSGSEFVQISAGGLVIGEVEGTAFDGKAGKNLKDWQDSKDATLPDVFITSIGSPTQTNEGVRFGVSRRDKDATKDSQYNLSLNNATNTTNGLMSGKDKLKLNSLYNIDSLKILEAYDATSRQYTVNLVKNVYGIGTAGNISENLTISSATSTEAGLMSAQDKVKLDNIDNIPTYTSVSEVPVDVTAKQIKLIIRGEECLFTRAKNGTYIAFDGGVNSQAGNTEKLEFIVLTPHLDADNNIDSWVTTSHISIDEAKYKSLVTTINDLSAKIDNLTSRLLVLEGYHQSQRRD